MERVLDRPELTLLLREIARHAAACHPLESCGLVTGPHAAVDGLSRHHAGHNAQDEFHRLDPDRFPRTARDAFFFHPRDLLKLERHLSETDDRLQWIVHSHPDAAAYFSDEDERCAAPEGGPLYPGVDHLVVGLRREGPFEFARFRWDAAERKHVEVERLIRDRDEF